MLFFKIIIIGAPICQPFETKIFIAILRTLTALAHYTTTKLQVLFDELRNNFAFFTHTHSENDFLIHSSNLVWT